jgi:alpha-1,2-mannosyltransferase
MIGQSLGAAVLSFEALVRATPDVFFDSTGWAFTYMVAKLTGCSIGCYVHYPTVSSDMLKRVRAQRPGITNSSVISSNMLFSVVKVVYYYAYALVYCVMGTLPQIVMVNSKWTQEHIDKMWSWRKGHAAVVYPPCNTEELQVCTIDRLPLLALHESTTVSTCLTTVTDIRFDRCSMFSGM